MYLSETELTLLEREIARAGATRSELMRRAIRARYRQVGVQARRDGIRSSAGAWKDRDVSGAAYVEAIREDLDDRLERHRRP